jgi:glycosyltransferase involved in cell wall biosynthesis
VSVSIPESRTRRSTSAASGGQGHSKTNSLEISLLLSTYEKPWHLKRVLTSIAVQEHVADRMELIVTDDGSSDETADLVARFAQSVNFPVRFTTHDHTGFQLARCRNEGVAASRAPYLLFLDGDCLLPPDHVWQHLKHRSPGEVMGGYCVRLDRETSERVDEVAIRSQAYLQWIPPRALISLAIRDWKSRVYRLLRHPLKPKLAGGNIGIWRSDYDLVNGYDENFQGWGGEDDDLRRRLGRVGVQIGSILRWTRTYHLWHPPDPSAPAKASLGANYKYFLRRGSLTRCRNGLVKRDPNQLNIRLVNHSELTPAATAWLAANHIPSQQSSDCPPDLPTEIELAIYPGVCNFSRQSEYKILAVFDKHDRVPAKLLKAADIILTDKLLKVSADQVCRPLADISAALTAI